MDEDAVEPQEDAVTMMETPQEEEPELEQDEQTNASESRTQVPLSALQKERKKRQELELELKWERQRQERERSPKPEPIEDETRFESATREDLAKTQNETVRILEERLWIKSNPEKYEKINEFLPQFLKQRPNLVSAIYSASNRYEEAYTLMEALTPKQQQQIKKASAPKKEAPNAPTGVPKAAAMNQAVDVMSMNDSEFLAWRKEQRRRR